MKDETAHRVGSGNVGALTTPGSFACTKQKSRMMVIHLDRLAPSEGTARDERLYEGSSWRVITLRTEPHGRKVKPITDNTSTALGKDEMAVRL
jgi:hypothetical protein